MDECVVPGDLQKIIEKGRKAKTQMRFETAAILKINGIYHYYLQSKKSLGANVAVSRSKSMHGPWKFYGTPEKPID